MANLDYGAIPIALAESTSEALNTKLGVTTGFKPSEWPTAIASIPTGGGGETIPCLMSSGDQAITLPIYDDGGYTFKFKLMVLAPQYNTLILGGYWNEGCLLFNTYKVEDDYVLSYFPSNTSVSAPMKLGQWMDIELTPSYMKVDDVTYQGTAAQRYHNQTRLFAYDNVYGSSIALSEMKIYDSNDNLVMDLEPRKDSDGYGYYYDKVGNNDYYSSRQPLAYSVTGGNSISIEQVLTDGRISNRDYGTVNLDKNILGYDWAFVRIKKAGQTSTALFDLSKLDGTNYIEYKYNDLAVFVTVRLSDSTLKCFDYGGAWDIIDADVSVFNGDLFDN